MENILQTGKCIKIQAYGDGRPGFTERKHECM